MIYIDYRDKRPIYEQIVEQIERLASTGGLAPEEQLPSVRKLAMTLSINPNTIAKAYAILEQRGIVYTRPGMGAFVTGDLEQLRRQRAAQVEEKAAALLREAGAAGVDLLALVQKLQEQEERTHDQGGKRDQTV